VFRVVLICLGLGSALAAQSADAGPVLTRVSDYITQYYARAQSLLVAETVILQPLDPSWSLNGFARRLEYELRIEWDPSAAGEPATVVRTLVRASGPPIGPPDQPDCMDPRTVSPEPLAFLLPEERRKFTFELAGSTRMDGQPAVMLDFRAATREPPKVKWTGDCAQVDLPGRTRGRIWADAETSEILRLDEHLVGLVDIAGRRDGPAGGPLWLTIERADTSIRYRRVTFENPDEVLMVPARIDSLTVIRNSGIPRLRTIQTYDNYRRFVTDSRIVP
jgi:hypothetical protein